MELKSIPQIRVGKLSESIEREIAELVAWMESENISGCVLSISERWSKHVGIDKHDHKSYRRMSTLLKIAHERGLLRFEWMDSKSPIAKKVYQVLPKPVNKQSEHDTKQENGLARGYKLSSNMVLDLMSFSEQENITNSSLSNPQGF